MEDAGNNYNTINASEYIYQGVHYCYLMSPFRVMEWIYVDSLYFRDSIKYLDETKEEAFLQ